MFAGCGGDKGGTTGGDWIQGTWKGTNSNGDEVTFIFDGKGGSKYTGPLANKEAGTYTLSGDTITITQESFFDTTQKYFISIEGTTLTLTAPDDKWYVGFTLTNPEYNGGYLASNTGRNSGGAKPAVAPEVGYYTLVSMTADGETYSAPDIGAESFYILLNEDGTMELSTEELLTGTWKDGQIFYKEDGEDVVNKYMLDKDMLTIEAGDGSVKLVFKRSSGTPPASNGTSSVGGSVSASGLTDTLAWWDGEWYGYWTVPSTNDPWSFLEDGIWDCYAVIDVNADGSGTVYLWDDDMEIATVDILISEDGGVSNLGAAKSISGYFRNEPIRNADWIIDPGLHNYDDFMWIDGRLTDSDGDYFDYEFFLRPWGMLWSDIPEDERPPFYDNWYMDYYQGRLLDALADTTVDGEPAFIHPGALSGTSGSSGGDTQSLPPEPSGNGSEVSHEIEGITVSAVLPDVGWCSEKYSGFDVTLYFHNVPSLADTSSNTPRISVQVKSKVEDFDRTKDKFENLQTIANRTIGGIDMTGRTYKHVGMEWIEYIGKINDTRFVSIRISKIDISGGEGSAVLDSIKFN
jgi:hypothetical protein